MSSVTFEKYRITYDDLLSMLEKMEPKEVAWVLMSIFIPYQMPLTGFKGEQDKLSALFLNLHKNNSDELLVALKGITQNSHDWQSLLQAIWERCEPQQEPTVAPDKIIFTFDGSIINQVYGEISQKGWDIFCSRCKKIIS